MLDTNVSQPYPKIQPQPENRVLLHLHTSNVVVSLGHLDYSLISLSTTCYKAFLLKNKYGTFLGAGLKNSKV